MNHAIRPNQERQIRVLVVDDEPLAREGVNALLSQDPVIEIAAICASGESAVNAITELEPDIVFLDVQMPGMNGFDVIRKVGVDRMPFIIFTTAFDQYALDAFEAHAVEYLLKPFSDDRFHDALARGKSAVRERRLAGIGERLSGLLDEIAEETVGAVPARIPVRGAGKTYFVSVEDIDWIEGADYYANVHAGGRHHLVRETLTSLTARLDANTFLRVHRSAIVNVTRVREIKSSLRREAIAILHDGTRIKLARGARAKLEEMLVPRK